MDEILREHGRTCFTAIMIMISVVLFLAFMADMSGMNKNALSGGIGAVEITTQEGGD